MAVALASLLAVGSASAYTTSSIADVAERSPDGAYGGQCIVFAANVLQQASGGAVRLSAYASGYQGTYAANGGREVGSGDAGRGDVIQVTPAGTPDSWKGDYSPLHTAIILRNRGGGSFDVIDSNYAGTERVLRHTYNPYGSGKTVKIWRFGSGGGGSFGEGSFVRVSGTAEVYRVVGGAPVYVSNWGNVGGSQPTTEISQAQFNALRPYPADGTFVNTPTDGRAYVVAGGAPLYLSSWDAVGGQKASIPIDQWAVDNPGNPLAHFRQNPVDGTLLAASSGRVYVVAGGAPLYVSNWDNIGGSRPSVRVDQWAIDHPEDGHAHLRRYPADGTLINTPTDGRVYVTAGGAPLYVSSWDAVGGQRPSTAVDRWAVDNPQDPNAHLRRLPANGTFLAASSGRVYVTAGGAPIYVSKWDAVGGQQPSTRVDQWAIDHPSDPHAHLLEYPLNGTFVTSSTGRVFRIVGGAPFYVHSWSIFGGQVPSVRIDDWAIQNRGNPEAHIARAPRPGTTVRGAPSGKYWSFLKGGRRERVARATSAIAVDDWGVAGYPKAKRAGHKIR